MTTQLLGGLLLPLLFAGGLGYAILRSRAGKVRRVNAIAPGRVVIASNLVSSRLR
ncbi:MAG TPA: hypothetical protein VF400_04545 [Anaeromyxobacteraceae bacterium]